MMRLSPSLDRTSSKATSAFLSRPVSQMRELERDLPSDESSCTRLAVIGRGRLGMALAAGVGEGRRRSGRRRAEVIGPLGHGADGAGAEAVLLCVPDKQIATAASAIAPGPAVGHCSGATGLDPLAPHEALSLNPLRTVTRDGASLAGAGAAIAGSTPRALALAGELAASLGMRAVEVADGDRAAYH